VFLRVERMTAGLTFLKSRSCLAVRNSALSSGRGVTDNRLIGREQVLQQQPWNTFKTVLGVVGVPKSWRSKLSSLQRPPKGKRKVNRYLSFSFLSCGPILVYGRTFPVPAASQSEALILLDRACSQERSATSQDSFGLAAGPWFLRVKKTFPEGTAAPGGIGLVTIGIIPPSTVPAAVRKPRHCRVLFTGGIEEKESSGRKRKS